MTHRDVYKVVALLAIGYVIGWFHRRWHLKDRLRRRMRALGMIPVLAIAWCTVEVHALTAQAQDSVFTMPWVTDQIGKEIGGPAIYCIARHSDFGSLVVVVTLAPIARDTVTTENVLRLCPNPDPKHAGELLPMFWDRPECPDKSPPYDGRPFILVRCERRWFRFPLRLAPAARSL